MKYVNRDQLARYHQLPKEFVGPLEADDLFFIHDALKDASYSSTYLYTAGSAAAESGLIASHLTNDERHYRIDCADKIWKQAQDAFIKRHIEDDWSESKILTIPDRIEMSRIYNPLYHDMIEGNVRQETIEKTHHRLIRLGLLNLKRHDQAEQISDFGALMMRRGLAYELGTLMTATRLVCPSFFAIPATARADNGEHFPEETHDVRLIHQSWGQIKSCIPYEVKPTDGKYRHRYRSAYVRGRVELLMPSSTNPLDLVRYMAEEQQGTISNQHRAELNEITSRVLRQAEDYKNRMPLGAKALDSTTERIAS